MIVSGISFPSNDASASIDLLFQELKWILMWQKV